MADPVQVQAFNVKFDEAIGYLKDKLPEASLRWDDLAGPVHAKVFTIAGATSVDLVREIQASLVRGLENGTTISQFRKDFDVAVQKHGWTYKGKRGWRTGVIFNTNMRSATMAGRWDQLQANKANRPYLQYRTAGDARVRPQHRQWNGLVYKIDDDFWKTHYPPNGWGCRCTVRAYGKTELDSKGLSEAKPLQAKNREVIGRDGILKDIVPDGIDPGWDHNVGQSWIAPELSLGQKLAELPMELRTKIIDKTISPAFQTAIDTNLQGFFKDMRLGRKPDGSAQIIGYFDSAIVGVLAEKLPDIPLQSLLAVVFDKKTRHLSGEHKQTKARSQVWPDDFKSDLAKHFRNYRAVLWDLLEDSLYVIPQENYNETVPTIKLRLNQTIKGSKAGASVISLGSASVANLKDPNKFRLLLGTVRK